MGTIADTSAQLDRLLKGLLRNIHPETLQRDDRETITLVKKALHEIRLDVRDYDYAQTREEQLKWAKIGKHNLAALNTLLLRLDVIVGAADMAELGALIETLREKLA